MLPANSLRRTRLLGMRLSRGLRLDCRDWGTVIRHSVRPCWQRLRGGRRFLSRRLRGWPYGGIASTREIVSTKTENNGYRVQLAVL